MENIGLGRLNITVSFTPEDLERLQRSGTTMPPFWIGHQVPPAAGDLLRFGLYQCKVVARVWEHTEDTPVLRLYMSDLMDRSDETPH